MPPVATAPPSSTAAPRAAASRARRRSDYRADIDGLRALAILLVVAYHVWADRVSGGVDVFLMVSAYFLTATFLRRYDADEPLRVRAYWAHRFRRLVPPAAVTILGVLAVAWLAYPATRWPSIWRESWASLLYVENWALAFAEVDYYARDEAVASPLQHFWSLSVQGQVFLLWPLVFVAAAAIARATRIPAPTLALAAFGAIFAGSFVWSIIETRDSQVFAYFDTSTRLWEFAAGSLIAIATPSLRIPAWLRFVLGWIGVVGIVACGLVLDVQAGFPGYLALWPVVCTAFVIMAGAQPTRGGPGRLLASRPLRFLGRDAYALYLVHWPVLITWMVVTGDVQIDAVSGTAIVLISLALARLVSGLFDAPIRRIGDPRRAGQNLAVALTCAVLVGGSLAGWQYYEDQRARELTHGADASYPGAGAVAADGSIRQVPEAPLVPGPTAIGQEWVGLEVQCAGELRPDRWRLARHCQQTEGAAEADRLVVVIGDSHSAQFMGALLPIAEQRGWGVVSFTKGGCSIGLYDLTLAPDGDCAQYRRGALDYALEVRPDAVFAVVTRTDADGREFLLKGVEEVVTALDDAGIPVIGVRDNPRYHHDMYTCALVGREGEAGPECETPVQDALDARNPALALGDAIVPVDFTPWICPDGLCRPEIGNVAVYFDKGHLTETFVRTLAPVLSAQIRGVIPE